MFRHSVLVLHKLNITALRCDIDKMLLTILEPHVGLEFIGLLLRMCFALAFRQSLLTASLLNRERNDEREEQHINYL